MVEGYIEPLTRETVGDIVNRGGTILGSARLPEFKDIEVRKKAIAQLKKRGIEAVVVIGGDGSYRGALSLTEMGINCIGLPGTIDTDITCTDYTIGFQTALETVVECVDKLRDTSNSHHRCSIVEVMGNRCGDLALWSGIACGYIVHSFLDLAVKFKAAGQFFVGFNAHNGKVAFSILRDENWFRIIMTKCRNFIVIIP